jgi:hypothetical protein
VQQARGNPMQMTVIVDADHAGDIVTKQSRTGVGRKRVLKHQLLDLHSLH